VIKLPKVRIDLFILKIEEWWQREPDKELIKVSVGSGIICIVCSAILLWRLFA
jgi:hypothetical protein